jgi:branched-chain amino acid transport system substrate-binding protein
VSGACWPPRPPYAQAKEQFFPLLSGRTGPVAPNATPWANGHNDYMKLVNARGGINGVMTLVEECETAYATDKGVECYERLKGKHGGATVFQPLSTGITFALTDKAPATRSRSSPPATAAATRPDGNVFKWNFPLVGTTGWPATRCCSTSPRRKAAGTSSRARRSPSSTTTARSARNPAHLQERSKMHGFELLLLPVPAPGVEQKSIWLQVRQQQARLRGACRPGA